MAACDIDTLQSDACANGFANASTRQLLVVIAQLLCTGMTCDVDQILSDACTNGFTNLSEEQLMWVIAQLLCNGGGGGGGGTNNQSGSGSPVGVAVPDYVGQFYINTDSPYQVWYSVGLTNADWQPLLV